MLKDISKLGKTLKKVELQTINGSGGKKKCCQSNSDCPSFCCTGPGGCAPMGNAGGPACR